ncbi:MAG: sodium:calcium antiporter, partial [Myxococcota bacterium]|nr:sodium:calcium antiporter [Myxococcota bacterium]
GLSVVAIGTSLPEIGASVVASLRKQGDLAIGNALGSCIFNLVFVLGLTTAIQPMPVALGSADGVGVDLAVATAASAVLIPILWTSRKIVRVEGILMLIGYAAFVTYLVISS